MRSQASPALSSLNESDNTSPIGVRFSTVATRLNDTLEDFNVHHNKVDYKMAAEPDQVHGEHLVNNSVRLEPCGIVLTR